MVDKQIILQSVAQHDSALTEIGKANKEIVLDELAAAGFTRVNVTFDGESDSGQIDDLSAYVGDVLTKLPDRKLMFRNVSWGNNEVTEEEKSLADAIEHLCYDFLELEHGGWENNDGAYGEFILDVAGRTVELDFNGRYTDVSTSTHSF